MSTNEIRKPNKEIANKGELHCPCVIAIDTSGSMCDDEQKLNEAIKTFIDAIKSDPMAKGRVEPMIITFNSTVDVVSTFGPVYDYDVPTVTCSGTTSFYRAIDQALDEIELRKKEYRDVQSPFYRPWLMVFTDGYPTDKDNGVSTRLLQAQKNKKVVFFSCAIGDGCDEELLKSLHTDHITLKADKETFQNAFAWLSDSMSAVSSSKPGETVKMPNPSNYQISVEV